MRNRLHIKVDLELHSISCPGVWLCPSGYVEITLKTLGYFFKTGPMEPKFPLLAHESFAMEGFFKSVRTLEDLEKAIASELIEIAIWQTGRRLAYYKGSLGRILQSVASHTDCVHILRFGSCIQKQIVVQLLMNPSRNFPGVLAPKIEISGRTTVRNPGQVYSGYHRDPSEIPLNLPPVEKEEIPHEERHNQIKSLKRQRPVCHAKKMSKLATAPGCLQADGQRIEANDDQIPVCILANKIRYGDVTQRSVAY
ncbi:unnamed protein product [Hermetia illucens]|uniref:Spermatogenesis-associated protein 6 N-terminal domain-containing protein n=1 Tax=Hermetia illucens TaxID=343691 RepID=A0A7R8UIY2_HERIL|nr:unnamed protein product [Hermetia illucens]